MYKVQKLQWQTQYDKPTINLSIIKSTKALSLQMFICNRLLD